MSTERSTLMLWNVWSILNEDKLSNFLQIIQDFKANIVCVNETWFNSKKGRFSHLIKEAGYLIYHSCREEKRGGGVAVIYKEGLDLKQIDTSVTKFSSFEYVLVKIKVSKKQTVMIANVYRKQEIPMSCFIEEFTKHMDKTIDKCDSIIAVGDFNVWAEDPNNTDFVKLRTLMNSYGLTQKVQEVTHRNGHILDQIYSNEYQIDLSIEVCNDTHGLTTDHFPILIQLPPTTTISTEEIKQYRKLNNINMDRFREDLSNAYVLIDGKDFETKVKQFDSISREIMDKHAPLQTKKFKRPQPPWIDAQYREERAKRRKYEREWKRMRTEHNRDRYIRQKALCMELCAQKQKIHYTKIMQNAAGCQKTLFKIANTLMDKNECKVLPPHSDPEILANDFNNFYVDKVRKIRESIPMEISSAMTNPRYFVGEKLEIFTPTNSKEVLDLIGEFGLKTSMDDPIPAKIAKPNLDIILPVLVDIINQSMAEGSMEGVKTSVIDPLIKKEGLDPTIYKNYRPVNKLPFISKITERIVLKRLNSHMTNNALHEPSQYGYKKFHSTETMILNLVNEALEAFDDNMATVVIFLDLSAAFDTIDTSKLLEILKEEIGIYGVALNWFESFLTGRTQKVKINGHYSQENEVLYGVPQGSVLGPCLFGINVRSQPYVFKECKFSTSSFADDSNGRKKFALSFQFQVLHNEIPKCMEAMIRWSNLHFMKINPDKTEIILLRPPSLNSRVLINGVFIGDQCIRFSNEVKNVGVWLDENLNFNKQVNSIVSQGYKINRDIRKIKKFLERENLEQLIHAAIASRLDYCNSILYGTSRENMYKLQKLQNSAAKLILGQRKRDSASEALRELHWLNVESRITFKVLLTVYKATRNEGPVTINLNYNQWSCRSINDLKLETPWCKTAIGERLIAYHGTRLWNALPLDLRTEDMEKFKKKLKTLLFNDHEKLKKEAFKYKS